MRYDFYTDEHMLDKVIFFTQLNDIRNALM
jgi:hypothetical protein